MKTLFTLAIALYRDQTRSTVGISECHGPSVTLTDRVKQLLAANKDISKLASSHRLGLGQPIHVANMAVYLASDESGTTTGQILSVDSGVTIY